MEEHQQQQGNGGETVTPNRSINPSRRDPSAFTILSPSRHRCRRRPSPSPSPRHPHPRPSVSDKNITVNLISSSRHHILYIHPSLHTYQPCPDLPPVVILTLAPRRPQSDRVILRPQREDNTGQFPATAQCVCFFFLFSRALSHSPSSLRSFDVPRLASAGAWLPRALTTSSLPHLTVDRRRQRRRRLTD